MNIVIFRVLDVQAFVAGKLQMKTRTAHRPSVRLSVSLSSRLSVRQFA